MAKAAVVHVRLSESAQAMLAATYDLVQAIEDSDPMLVSDEIMAAYERLRTVVDDHSGEL